MNPADQLLARIEAAARSVVSGSGSLLPDGIVRDEHGPDPGNDRLRGPKQPSADDRMKAKIADIMSEAKRNK